MGNINYHVCDYYSYEIYYHGYNYNDVATEIFTYYVVQVIYAIINIFAALLLLIPTKKITGDSNSKNNGGFLL